MIQLKAALCFHELTRQELLAHLKDVSLEFICTVIAQITRQSVCCRVVELIKIKTFASDSISVALISAFCLCSDLVFVQKLGQNDVHDLLRQATGLRDYMLKQLRHADMHILGLLGAITKVTRSQN